MPISALLSAVLPPIHLLAYSTLLGTELYQSFVMTKIAYQALPRSSFTTLQKSVFPVYFQAQSMLLFVVAVTIPPQGPVSLIQKKSNWIGLAVTGITAGLNLIIYGPKTKNLMIARIHQATRYANLQLGAGIISDKMQAVIRSFSKAHAMSIHLNLMTIIGTLFYGWQLASKMKF